MRIFSRRFFQIAICTTLIFLSMNSLIFNSLQDPNSSMWTNDNYLEPFYTFTNASYYTNVTIINNDFLILEHIPSLTIPTPRDRFTLDNSSINDTYSRWDATNILEPPTLSTDKADYPDNLYSINLTINSTNDDGIIVSCSNYTSFDSDLIYQISFWLRFPDLNLTEYPMRLDIVLLGDNNTNLLGKMLFQNIVENNWSQYNISFNRCELTDRFFGTSPMNRTDTKTILLFFSWVENYFEGNFSMLFDYLEMYDLKLKPYGEYISQWINSNSQFGFWDHLICWTNDISQTKVFVSRDNITWIEINATTYNSPPPDHNLLNLYWDISTPILFKVELRGYYTTPAIDYVLIQYISLDISIFLSLLLFKPDYTFEILSIILLIATVIGLTSYIIINRRSKLEKLVES